MSVPIEPTDAVLHPSGISLHPAEPVNFSLVRYEDRSGVSGCGVVAWGTVYPTGKVTLAWKGDTPSVNIYDSLADVTAIHGHDGATVVVPDGRQVRSQHRPRLREVRGR